MTGLTAALLLLALPAGAPVAASAPAAPPWSFSGHAIVCEIAWQRLSEAGRRFVLEVMPSGTVFAESCSWPDEVRRTTHRATYEYHFINGERGAEHLAWERDCGGFDCVSVAVVRYARYLARPVASEGDRERRWDALRFLAHFVGDLHQPLHAGYRDDLGGNRTEVSWDGEAERLHWVWDGAILERMGLEGMAGGRALAAEIDDEDAGRWQGFDVYGWTEESFEVVRDEVYDFPGGEDLAGTRYAERAEEVVRERLAKAGVRLAFLIEAAADGRLDFPPFPPPRARSQAAKGSGAAAGNDTLQLLPVDEAAQDPELFLFRARLLQALAAGDTAAIVEAAHPDIELSFGGDWGRDTFREWLRQPEYWNELAEVLTLGGVFRGEDSFSAPYVFGRFPEGADAFQCLAVLGENVRVRAEPSLEAPILGTVSYEVVCTDWEATTPEGWTPIEWEGGVAYVATSFLRSAVDYRAIFSREEGRWWLKVFIAGD